MGQHSENKQVTHARRQIIVELVEQLGEPTTKQILAVLNERHAAGLWPEAPWAGAAQEPYEGGLYQHLSALERQERIVRVKQDHFYDKWHLAEPKLRKHAAEALELEKEGLSRAEIATRLGLSSSLVAGLLTDPTGEKERERKKAYCPGCGAKKAAVFAVCGGCVERRQAKRQADAEALLPTGELAVRILDTAMVQRLAGCDVAVGVTLESKRIIRWLTRRGEIEHQLHPSDAWEDGMVAIGLWRDRVTA